MDDLASKIWRQIYESTLCKNNVDEDKTYRPLHMLAIYDWKKHPLLVPVFDTKYKAYYDHHRMQILLHVLKGEIGWQTKFEKNSFEAVCNLIQGLTHHLQWHLKGSPPPENVFNNRTHHTWATACWIVGEAITGNKYGKTLEYYKTFKSIRIDGKPRKIQQVDTLTPYGLAKFPSVIPIELWMPFIQEKIANFEEIKNSEHQYLLMQLRDGVYKP